MSLKGEKKASRPPGGHSGQKEQRVLRFLGEEDGGGCCGRSMWVREVGARAPVGTRREFAFGLRNSARCSFYQSS